MFRSTHPFLSRIRAPSMPAKWATWSRCCMVLWPRTKTYQHPGMWFFPMKNGGFRGFHHQKWWIYGDVMVINGDLCWEKYGGFMGWMPRNKWWFDDLMVIYPLVNIQKSIEHGPVEIVSFPMNSMVIFQFVMWTFTRGYQHPIGCSWWIYENMNSRLVGISMGISPTISWWWMMV